MSTRILICCGSGGVGKTTISAALGIAQARAGRRACVVTIDPARRLADSLGIESLGNQPQPIDLSSQEGCTGSLSGMMLDAQGTFDEVIRKFSKSADSAQRLLDNRYYQFASSRLGGSHEYMAMHKLLELVDSGDFDTVVLDTPPTQQALEFIAAPHKMRGLMDQGVLRWLVMPASRGGWRALELGSELLAKALQKLLGRNTINEIAEFFESFQEHWQDFRERSERAQALLRSPNTRFVLVTAPAPIARDEALGFLEILRREELPMGGFVVNRVLSAPLHCTRGGAMEEVPGVKTEELLEAVERRFTQSAADAKVIETLQAAARSPSKGSEQASIWIVEDQGPDLHSVEGLERIVEGLPTDLWSPQN
jgi:anion-transporting  ArsA/GET3 family ATPase